MNNLDEILKDSIIIAAHPDDEVLWFSSILDKVNHINFCFLKSQSNPIWTEGRMRVFAKYPLDNISCLNLDEAEIFNQKNWNNAEVTKFGITIKQNGFYKLKGMRYIRNYYKYIRNYYKLKNNLRKTLSQYRNVFTHNPWGEYGNEEHVQVYRVVKELKKDLNFNLYFNNYSSNISLKLMSYYLNSLAPKFISSNTNKTLGRKIQDLYTINQCWTWYDEWRWADCEVMIKDISTIVEKEKFGKTIPINFINVKINGQEHLKKSLKQASIKKNARNTLSTLKSKLKIVNISFS